MAAKKRKRKGEKKTGKGSRPRVGADEGDILDRAEELLAQTSNARKAARALARELKMSFRHATRFVDDVFLRWRNEADTSKREERRALIEAQIDHVYTLCVTRGFKVTKKNGTVVHKIDVDSKGALAAIMMRAQLHGDLQPIPEGSSPQTEEAMLALANAHFGGGVYIDAKPDDAPSVPSLPPAADGAEAP